MGGNVNSLRRGFLLMAGIMALMCVCGMASGRKPRQPSKPPQETYMRPKPVKPIKPQIPSVNRNQPGKVFLEKADSLYADEMNPDMQKVKGNVVFRQGGMFMYCDSAYYYPDRNSMDAFGDVRMMSGDTLRVDADVLYYDGVQKLARLRTRGRKKVTLSNRNVQLTTDSLDYSLMQELGWYDCGGKLTDQVNILTSQYGQYSPATKFAEFETGVVLVNIKDGYRMETERLLYNTSTHIASIDVPTRIYGRNDTILTSKGEYNTQLDHATLESRSTIMHRDSAGNTVTLEGDSIIYDKRTRISRAYRFRDQQKDSRPMVLTDTAHRAILFGGEGYYNDSTREAYATDNPLLKEYSRPDTLFLRADSIRTFIRTMPAFPKGLTTEQRLDSSLMQPADFHIARAFPRARFFRQDIQGIADTIYADQADSIVQLLRRPIVWSGERQVMGNHILVHINDTTADWALLPDYGIVADHIDEDFYNQLTGKRMYMTFADGTLNTLEAEGNVHAIFLPMEKDSTYNKLINAESSFLSVNMTGRQLEKLKMWPEVQGQVMPIPQVKRADKTLPGFRWWEEVRPQRYWYGNEWRWADDLGDLPDAVIEYFNIQEPLVGKPRGTD